MSNLVTELGCDYINQFFAGTYFRVDDDLYVIKGSTDPAKLIVNAIKLGKEKIASRWTSKNIPSDVLADFSVLRYPRLGYRNSAAAPEYGNLVVHFGHRRSVFRGLRGDTITCTSLPIYEAVLPSGISYVDFVGSPNDKAIDIFQPTFIPFVTGMQMINEGECLGFAVSEDIAVAVASSDDPSKVCDVLFRGHTVGRIDTNGTLSLSNKILERASIRKKLQ